ncbi:MAG: superoxide dismutase family protein [Flavobacteriaceae bacterium]|nr:superoxide dismutase family protein [Flavobacteriaceae bacterium]|tara:strand:+ start:517 stop:1053 length:537 start_codon:yes stop_codon:yes gene_type:complete
MKNFFLLLATSLLLLSCSIPNMIVVELESKNSSNVTGNVVFIEEGEKVNMIATINNLNPGDHAIHIHEKSDCSSIDGKSTGGHWNPTLTNHGKWGDENGYHIGDIGNFTANKEGIGIINFSTDLWCLDCDDVNKNIMGKAIIVHQGIDDFISQPSGAAGSRISCGGIILKNAVLNSED